MLVSKNKKQTKIKILAIFTAISFVMANFFVYTAIFAQDAGNLNSEITEKRKEIDSIQKRINEYNNKIKEIQKEASSLGNQISILENQIAKVELDIQATEARIEQNKLEIETINQQVKDLEEKIVVQKQTISEYIRLIHKNDQVSYLEVLLVNSNFSEFFDQISYTENLHGDLKEKLDDLKKNITDLDQQKLQWEEKIRREEVLKNDLQQKIAELDERNQSLDVLLDQSKLTERQYQSSKYQLQLEQQQINSDIVTLEKKIRAELEKRKEGERFDNFGPARLGWPVDPSRGITAYFHDSDYPFKHIFEHPAIDVRAYQGTTIKAAESGYVAAVKYKGDTSYAYVMVIHNDGLSTVYGHVSKVLVKQDQYVSKGEAIALSGGAPGTTGAGNLTTGPHLHFEVRHNGIPVDPLKYLP